MIHYTMEYSATVKKRLAKSIHIDIEKSLIIEQRKLFQRNLYSMYSFQLYKHTYAQNHIIYDIHIERECMEEMSESLQNERRTRGWNQDW